jgi:spermidine synthase
MLAYEIALMHILSIVQWYHFGYMIISVALLGFGASGTLLTAFQKRLLKNFELTFALTASLSAVSVVVCFSISQSIPFDAYLVVWNPNQFWYLLVYYLLMAIPFVLGGTCIGLAFIKYAENIGLLYFANLAGSALGGLTAIGLMWIIFPKDLLVAIASLGLVSTIVASAQLRPRWTLLVPLLISIIPVTYYGLMKPMSLRVSQYKSVSKSMNLPDARIVCEKTSPLGFLQVLSSPVLRYSPGLSLAYSGDVPVQLGVFNNGEWAGAIMRRDSNDSKRSDNDSLLDYTTSALPYHIIKNPEVLILGVGTGTEVISALQHRAESVTGVELNPQVIDLVAKEFRNVDGGIYDRMGVKIITAEARSFLSRNRDSSDLIVVPLMEGFAASVAGMYSLNENYLFTVESFCLMLRHLKPGGILAVTEWLKFPERNTVKLMATLIEAMEKSGFGNPANHFASVRGWATSTTLVKQSPFTDEEISMIRTFCEQRSFDPIYFPGIAADEANRFNLLSEPIHYKSALSLLSPQKQSFYDQYRFFIEPPTDNKPHFSHFFKWKSLPYLMDTFGKQGVPSLEWGYLILSVTLIQVTLVSVVLIVVPLFFLRRSKPLGSRKGGVLIYFGGLGTGYMFVEIVLIQRFILFLGHPVYSASAVVAGMLLFSGIGSLCSKKLFEKTPRAAAYAVAGVVFFILIYLVGLDSAFNLFFSPPEAVRLCLAVGLLAPIGFFMGMPFPIGLKQLSKRMPHLVPWAWGTNGCASVISTVLAALLAIEVGFGVVLLCAACCYGFVGLVSRNVTNVLTK